MSFGMGGGTSEEGGWSTSEQKPEYQPYAQEQVGVLKRPANKAYEQAMYRLMNAQGFNPQQQQTWQQGWNQMERFGPEGPYSQTAQKYLKPYMGEGYMQTLDPYFTAQRAELEQAVPLEQEQYWQDMKRQLGGLWGTSGRGLEETAEGYGKLRSAQQKTFADLEGQKAAAAQAGINWTGQMTPQYAQMMDPTQWNQQRMQWQTMPEDYLNQQRATYAQQAAPWSEIALNIADMGYRYPVSVTTRGDHQSSGSSFGFGSSFCWVVRALFGETGKKTKILINLVNEVWPKSSLYGWIRYKLYMRFGERIANFIKKDGFIRRDIKKMLNWYFNRQYKKLN